MINNNPINSYINGRESRFNSSHSERSARIGLTNYPSSSVKISANKNLIMNNSEISMRKPAEVSFCGFSGSEPNSKFVNWLCTSKCAKKILEFAEKKQLIFDAAFALVLTCIFRPASIMVIPSKKNQDDQKYASAHSIASGIIGFVISNIIFTPISNAIKKIKDKPEDYITDKNSYLYKDGKKCLRTAKTYLDRLPDVVGSIPKGILTIALIPPILKYVFGMEKKKPIDKKESPRELTGGTK